MGNKNKKNKMRHILNVLTTTKENDHIAGSLVLKEFFIFYLEIQVLSSEKLTY